MQRTLENLAKAFAGESVARNRYTSYAKIAKKEGYEQIADALLTTADNEREHASWNLKLINALKAGAAENADEIHIEATVETSLGDTAANLRATIAGEHYETTTMYPEFADVADSEGLPEVAKRLRAIGVAEAHHEDDRGAISILGLEHIEGERGAKLASVDDIFGVCNVWLFLRPD